MVASTQVARFIKEDREQAEKHIQEYRDRDPTPEFIAFCERVSPLIDAGWETSDVRHPHGYVRKIVEGVAFTVKPERGETGKLELAVDLSTRGEYLTFDTPEAILEFTGCVEQELAFILA